MAARNYGQHSGVASALELVGERWALLIVSDLLVGPRRYSDLQLGLPRIPTNILSRRLKELQEGGVVRRVATVRGGYELTEYGRELDDVVLALGRWGLKALGEPQEADVVTGDSLTMAFRSAFDADAAGSLPATAYLVRVADIALALRVAGGELTVLPVGAALPASEAAERDAIVAAAELEFTSGPDIHHLVSGELAARVAGDEGVVQVLRGDPALLDRFAATFHVDLA